MDPLLLDVENVISLGPFNKGAVAGMGSSSSSSFTFGHTAGRRRKKKKKRMKTEEKRKGGEAGERRGGTVRAWPRRGFLPWLDVGSWPALAIHRKPSSGAPTFACTLFHLPLPPPGPQPSSPPPAPGRASSPVRPLLFYFPLDSS